MLTDPPGVEELEVSVFGPGKGESVVVHLGYGEWLIVDSCVNQADGSVPALDYLNSIGVDPAASVRIVLATHAHDDHIAGISRIFDACRSAIFVCSSALTREEFFATIELDELQPALRSRIRTEYARVFAIVEQRGRQAGGLKALQRALQGRNLYHRPSSSGRMAASVQCLSPSDEAVTRSIEALAQAFPRSGDLRQSPPADPNELAIALWVEFGGTSVLLGADLTIGPAGCGWQAVLATFHPQAAATLFKVPHHGSPNAHHVDVWDQLVDVPLALLAPYRGGRRPLPAVEDVERIKSVAREVHITASPNLPAQSRRVRREAAALNTLASRAVEPWGRAGHVRARYLEGELRWTVEHVPPARKL
jgi:beta-lactamase superfamily II metal-dependent hydrolase